MIMYGISLISIYAYTVMVYVCMVMYACIFTFLARPPPAVGSVVCEDFSAQEFRFKGTGGKRTFLGRDMTYAACLAKCQEQKVSGYCESRASSWGSCTYYAGGKREYAYFSVDSKTVNCKGKRAHS